MTAQTATIEGYRGVRTLVLGASGFLGGWVARLLSASQADLVLAARDTERAARLRGECGITGEIVAFDAEHFDRTSALIREVRPLVTFNLAGYGIDHAESDARAARRINSEFPGALCEALSATVNSSWGGAHLVHVGSGAEYGRVGGHLEEDGPVNPLSLYASTKLAGTRAALRRGAACDVRVVVARPFTVYGAGEHAGRLLPTLLEAALCGKTASLSAGTQSRDFVYVEDVAAALLLLGLSACPRDERIVNIATGRLTTVREFAERAAGALGMGLDQLRFDRVPMRSDEMPHEEVSVERLRRRIGWVPATPIETGVARTREPAQEPAVELV